MELLNKSSTIFEINVLWIAENYILSKCLERRGDSIFAIGICNLFYCISEVANYYAQFLQVPKMPTTT